MIIFQIFKTPEKYYGTATTITPAEHFLKQDKTSKSINENI